MSKEPLRHRAVKAFAGPAGYLFVVFVVLAAYAWLGDARVGPGLDFFILTTINAFIVFQLDTRKNRVLGWISLLLCFSERVSPCGLSL